MYPFDNYQLTSTFRAVSTDTNITLPIQKLVTISLTSAFVTISGDSASTIKTGVGSEEASRDLELDISRPAEARMFALLLFASSWMMSHASLGLVVLSSKLNNEDKFLKYMAATFVILLAIPQLRNAMPDAPDLDGALLHFCEESSGVDNFPQES